MKKNFTIAMTIVSLLVVMLFATSCKRTVPPTVAMVESSIAVSYDKALMVAEVVNDGRGTITEYGFCYGKMDEIPDTLLCSGNETYFSAELPDLLPSTVYTCMAFARNEAGRGYTDVYRFTTLSANDTIPLVDTYTVKDITYCSAVPSGQVLSGGGQEVMERGICYGTGLLPTVDGMHVALGSGVGPFECQLTDLLPETRYYVRAYAICTKGVYYGDQLSFDTKVLPLAVRTLGVMDVTSRRVEGRGEVIRDGGAEVTECGFCWGVEHQPTIEGLHIKVSAGLGEFKYNFSGLERGRTHYMRAYAINEEGVAYGEEVEFVPDDSFGTWSEGALPGLFSVSDDRQVRFSQGNLQYYADDNIWRFAESQWDYVGGVCVNGELGELDFGTVYANGVKCDNTLIGKYYEGWIDLFGWGTSGWDNGNLYYRPWDDKANRIFNPYFGPYGNYDLADEYSHADWGVHNSISNGGSRQWHTPTVEELSYILEERTTVSGIRYAKARVAGVCGLVLLPDDWDASVYSFNDPNEMAMIYHTNVISAATWLGVLEPAGAVFLPAVGHRSYSYSYEIGAYFSYYENESDATEGGLVNSGISFYWTSSQGVGMGVANCLFLMNYVRPFLESDHPHAGRANGHAVRLVTSE